MRKTLPAEAMANWLDSEIKAFNQTADNILADIDKYSSPQTCRDAAKRHHTHAHAARLILSEVNKWRDGEHPHIFDYHKEPTT